MVALAGASMVFGNSIYLNLQQKWELTLFVFVGIFWVYNRSLILLFFHKFEIMFSFSISIFLCLWTVFVLNISILVLGALILVAMLGLFYNLIKNVPGLKFWVVVFSWVFVCQGLPLLLNFPFQFDWRILSQGICIANVAFTFDLMDIETDHQHRKTIPQFLGSDLSKVVIYSLSVIYVLIRCFYFNNMISNALALIGGSLPMISLYFFKRYQRNIRLELMLEFSLVIIGISMWKISFT